MAGSLGRHAAGRSRGSTRFRRARPRPCTQGPNRCPAAIMRLPLRSRSPGATHGPPIVQPPSAGFPRPPPLTRIEKKTRRILACRVYGRMLRRRSTPQESLRFCDPRRHIGGRNRISSRRGAWAGHVVWLAPAGTGPSRRVRGRTMQEIVRIHVNRTDSNESNHLFNPFFSQNS